MLCLDERGMVITLEAAVVYTDRAKRPKLNEVFSKESRLDDSDKRLYTCTPERELGKFRMSNRIGVRMCVM